ncbi:hypothetical protein Taro_037237 [Colocasia esculenta]|uniref:RanBP2-type domain-containing protein n=1 Tax=Colocasia esculenta TaxID=4460 RepID=A0A843WP37_COLES|nr:hypothetical protein [Colocasia esculenta]
MASPMAASRFLRVSSCCSSASSSSFRWLFRRHTAAPSVLSGRLLLGAAAPSKVCPCHIRFASFPVLRAVSGASYSRFEQYTSGSSASNDLDAVEGPAEAEAGVVAPHPWPEWEGFLEKLREKGYLEGVSSDAEEGERGSGAAETATDYNRMKAACLAFARERFDLIKSLPKEDLQAVVECGCPNTDRKPTNSGKRLRAYLMLSEKDVCIACNLRGSCDRANLIPKQEEGARTVDILRIILCYAADPDILSRFEVSQRKQVEGSIRRLLSELIKLSDTVLDPTVVEPTVKHSTRQEQPQRSLGMENNRMQNVMDDKESGREVAADHDRSDKAEACVELATVWVGGYDGESAVRAIFLFENSQYGIKCSFLNFCRNLRCLKCKTAGPKNVDSGDVEMKKGDWTCQHCQFMNFARNKRCKRCQGQRPPRQLNPGEWECPSCDFLNYRRNRVCLKCNLERPGEEPHESAEHLWETPDISTQKFSAKRSAQAEQLPRDDDAMQRVLPGSDLQDHRKDSDDQVSSGGLTRPNARTEVVQLGQFDKSTYVQWMTCYLADLSRTDHKWSLLSILLSPILVSVVVSIRLT